MQEPFGGLPLGLKKGKEETKHLKGAGARGVVSLEQTRSLSPRGAFVGHGGRGSPSTDARNPKTP